MKALAIRRLWWHVSLFPLATLIVSGACLDRELKPLNPCLVSGVSSRVNVERVEKVDLLLMVDNSNSMAGEQASLKREFPNLIRILASGSRFEGDPDSFPPVKDLHVGVVSSDMGIPGVELGPACHADGGDDGRLQTLPRSAGCDAQYPSFLSFIGDPNLGQLTDVSKFANDVACIAMLGTGGCGFEQQLEAPLKALVPRVLLDASGNVLDNPFRFLSTTEPGTWGHGDVPVAQGGNKGFLRDPATEGQSVLAILLVTDEEDCSVKSTAHLKPNTQLAADSPYRDDDINLRCFKHKELLYDLRERYYNGFRALRPGREDLVVFAAIAGVPTDLVDGETLGQVDFKDEAQRDAFYAHILSDPRMQEEVDPSTMPGSGRGNLRPSCQRSVPGETEPAVAYPPRRLVELAQMFGENGLVQSICQEEFGPAIRAVIDIIAAKLDDMCLPRPLTRQADGLVPCNVVWELPAQAEPGSATPTRCEQYAFLGPVDEGRSPLNKHGGVNCKVQQLPVTDLSGQTVPFGAGWFYDTFTPELTAVCKGDSKQRVAFTTEARPPSGVAVMLECLNETQRLATTRTDLSLAVAQPEIGSSCAGEIGTEKPSGDAACVVTLQNATTDTSLFCHPNQNVCVQRCDSDSDCPPAWVCDSRPETLDSTAGKGSFCVNPTCGAANTETTD